MVNAYTVAICSPGVRCLISIAPSVRSPFTVSPANGTLAVNACMQVDIHFQSQTTGYHTGELALHYDTGKYDMYLQLYLYTSLVTSFLSSSYCLFPQGRLYLSNCKETLLMWMSDLIRHRLPTPTHTLGSAPRGILTFCYPILTHYCYLRQTSHVKYQKYDASQSDQCGCALRVEGVLLRDGGRLSETTVSFVQTYLLHHPYQVYNEKNTE